MVLYPIQCCAAGGVYTVNNAADFFMGNYTPVWVGCRCAVVVFYHVDQFVVREGDDESELEIVDHAPLVFLEFDVRPFMSVDVAEPCASVFASE